MPITTRLSRKLHQALGEEAGEDLVTWMQQVDVQRAELRELNELNFSRFDARLAEVREATRADIAELRQEMRALRAEFHQALQVGLSGVETKIEQRTAAG